MNEHAKLYDSVKSKSVGENWSGYITAVTGNKYQIKTADGYRWVYGFEFELVGKDDLKQKESTPPPKNINYL